MEYTEKIALAIRHYQIDNDLKQTDIAERLGITDATLRSKMVGRKEWRLDEFVQLCKLLDMQPSVVLGFA